MIGRKVGIDGPENRHRGLLQITVSLIFAARGWLTWKWDSPIRELIWEEDWWSSVLPHFGTDWAEFARTSDAWISPGLDGLGIALILLAFVPWLAAIPRLAWTRWFLIPGTAILCLDAFALWVSKDMQVGMALEHLLQIATPIALLIVSGAAFKSPSGGRANFVSMMLIVAAAATFIGHGLYAAGYYDPPLNFRFMTSEILPLSESSGLRFLKIVGWLDFVIVVLLLIPTARRGALIYMVCWGGLTTLARLLAYYDPELPVHGLDPWLAEALVRTPHWLVPLWLLLRLRTARPLAFRRGQTGGLRSRNLRGEGAGGPSHQGREDS